MWTKWQRSIYCRALEEARHTLGMAETGEGAVIVIVIAIGGIVVIWLAAGKNIAQSELLIRSASFIVPYYLRLETFHDSSKIC
jgi:hypothetical protein